MATQQVDSKGTVTGELLERRGSHPEDKRQTLLALLLLVLYLGAGMSGRSWETPDRVQDCHFLQSPMTPQGTEPRTREPSVRPVRALRSWLKDTLRVFLDKLEREVQTLEHCLRELEDWLDVLLGEGCPEVVACATYRGFV